MNCDRVTGSGRRRLGMRVGPAPRARSWREAEDEPKSGTLAWPRGSLEHDIAFELKGAGRQRRADSRKTASQAHPLVHIARHDRDLF